jgi:uncharacterized protein YciI
MEFEQPQDAHLAYLAGLHEAGHLLAVGPSADPTASCAASRERRASCPSRGDSSHGRRPT